MAVIEIVGRSGYALWWPTSLFIEEIENLNSRGTGPCVDREWVNEVELFLKQAFTSQIAADDFRQVFEGWDRSNGSTNPCSHWLSELADSANRSSLNPRYASL